MKGYADYEDVIAVIRSRQGDLSLRAYAKNLGISAAFLSDIFLRRRRPGPKVLKHFGLRAQRTVRVEYIYYREDKTRG